MTTLQIRERAARDGRHHIDLLVRRNGQPDQQAEADIEFALTEHEQAELRWYLEDYLQRADVAQAISVSQIEERMKTRGEELYAQVLAANSDTQALWFSIRNELADLRVEISSGVAEAASIPWELMRDPQTDSAISVRVKAFVRTQSKSNISFVTAPTDGGRVRLLYIACRPRGAADVPLRAVANRLLQGLGENRARFEIKALRPPTFEQLQEELGNAKGAGRPYHIVHFDGHGIYEDLSKTILADWLKAFNVLAFGSGRSGKHGYLLFEHPSEDKMRPVDGEQLGKLLHDNGVPILVLNACQSAMHEADATLEAATNVHDAVRAIGSLAQAVVDQGIPAVLGMRYSVYVVTAAQYMGQLYAALAKGRGFGQAATEGRKHLQLNPERWIGLEARPLQDWFVPVAYEAGPIELGLPAPDLAPQPELDPVLLNRKLLRYVPDEGFIGRDETILALDRAFDAHRVVLLHAYAGQGKSATAVEFARWYCLTGGLAAGPMVFLSSFESHIDLDDLLNQIGQALATDWSAVNDPHKRRELVLEILRQVPILWIWDNVEPVAGFPAGTPSQWTKGEQDELRDFLHQVKLDQESQARILLTSRREEKDWLGGIPRRIRMSHMSASDAARLALQLGEERGLQRSDIADWQPLLDYCAGNPLTLRVLVGQAIKAGLRGHQRIADFVDAIRSGEQYIEDPDETQGRDRSLYASLDYGFRNAFDEEESAIVALLHLFQGTVDVDVLAGMSEVGEYALPELKGRSNEQLASLLERAKDIGLLTHVGATYFTIHPALPWFLSRLFARHYDGQAGHSSSEAALRAWVEAVGVVGNWYHEQYEHGHRGVIGALELEEANLLQARRVARGEQWWYPVTSCMQGLDQLYDHQGRRSEWARLVEEIRPDFCTADDGPIPGREEDYTLVMQYRVHVAQLQEHDFLKAAALLEKKTEFDRERAVPVLALPEDAPLDAKQRRMLRSLAVSVFALGQILREQGDAACLEQYQESLAIDRRIADKTTEAIDEYNIGTAYKDIVPILDLDAAEAAYQRSLDLHEPDDALGRAKCIGQIGTVQLRRFEDARKHNEPLERQLGHARAAEERYLETLRLLPADDVTDVGIAHNQLGALYARIGAFDKARSHFEQDVQLCEKAGDHYGAGQTRFNMALMYVRATQAEDQPAEQRALLLRARAYAEAALRDFQRYPGRAADPEAQSKGLLDLIDQELAKLQ